MATDAGIAANKAMLKTMLNEKAARFAMAESCTGGALAALFAADSELGPHLERGFIAYSLDAKEEMLGVPRTESEPCAGVSPAVAEALARGALDRSSADYGVAITGFCGPQEAEEEVGLVYLALVPRGGPASLRECHFGDIGREKVLEQAVSEALELVIDELEREANGR